MTAAERPAERLTNPRADRVRKVAALAGRSARRRTGLFLAEGPQPVREALLAWLAEHESPDGSAKRGGSRQRTREDGFRPPTPDAVYFDPAVLRRHRDLAALIERLRAVLFDPLGELDRGHRVFLREASPEVIDAMSDAVTPQGIVAVCRIPKLRPGSAAEQSVDPPAGRPVPAAGRLGVALCRLQDPGNVGTVIRAADAAGAQAVLLTEGTVDVWSPKVVRAAAGSHFHLPLLAAVVLEEQVAAHRRAGVQILAAAGDGPVCLAQMSGEGAASLAAPTLWLLGNEGTGLSAEEQELADHRISIPLYGRAESLNVATAATVCLYASAMAQHAQDAEG